ncbi:SH3 domain-containing protein [Rhodobacter viridis]|uniref:SH3 domain-containing protein n=1 Tax=Rhodobacter viridis TaxID=1054202 RepID=UPI0015E89B20|nr:SH3 domain-containing protein [Rhodobacter viridis]
MRRIWAGPLLAALVASPALADFADGLSGGPDFWAVTGLEAGETLALRAEASARARALGKLAPGEVVRNKGCAMAAGARWCLVDTPSGPGWVEGRFLRESAPPGLDDSLPEPPLLTAPPGLPAGNGEPFTAFGTLACTTHRGQPSGTCAFGVIRTGPGGASLWVALPAGGQRTILFEAGKPVFTDGEGRPAFTMEDDLFLIRIGPERFEVPRAVIDGG